MIAIPLAGNGVTAKEQNKFARPLSQETDTSRLRCTVDFLWSLLDDIDTASDIAKKDDKLYRQIVEAIQSRRKEQVASDGCELYLVDGEKEQP